MEKEQNLRIKKQEKDSEEAEQARSAREKATLEADVIVRAEAKKRELELAAEAEAAAWLAQVAALAGKEHPYRQPRNLEAAGGVRRGLRADPVFDPRCHLHPRYEDHEKSPQKKIPQTETLKKSDEPKGSSDFFYPSKTSETSIREKPTKSAYVLPFWLPS